LTASFRGRRLDTAAKTRNSTAPKRLATSNSANGRSRRRKKKEEDEQREKKKEEQPNYSGISSVTWAHKSEQLLFVYDGDIFRMKVGEEKPERLTATRDNESDVRFGKDDDTFYFTRGGGVYKGRFDSPLIRQLNPELPNNTPMRGYRLSPDEKSLLIFSGRSTGPTRSVDYIVYRDRFAEAKKTQRGVADDKFNDESTVYLVDLEEDITKNDGKPWEVWKFPGGEELWETSVNEKPFSPDGKSIVFATWKRDSRDLEIVVGDLATKKLKTVYRTKCDGEHRTPSMTEPFFTKDGKGIVMLLENSGYRHAWVVDPLTEGATQLTKGDFETYPLEQSQDGKSLFVLSGKEHPARMNLYRVDMATGDYHRVTRGEGQYGTPKLSNSGRFAVGSFANWRTPSETYLIDTGNGRQNELTKSHRGTFEKVNTLQPTLFSYPNRLGQTIHGYSFIPKDLKPGEKRPLFLYVYGGPLGTGKSIVDGTFNSTAYLFAQYLTLKYGYITATIDPRGQSGYGAAFGKANWEQPGKAQVEDLVDGVKYLSSKYPVDPDRVGINGWSFGGFQTQMCLYTAPETFKLGIAGAGPTEWQNYNTWYTGGVIGNSRDGKPEDLDKYSLTHLAKNLQGNLLLLHGMEDTNVLFQDTVKVYRKLLQYGKGPLVELSLDPTGGHGMGGDMNTRDRHAIYEAYLLRYWGR
jgi:dipeptidyl aminopeptidase/acylaminoacyl peptidase